MARSPIRWQATSTVRCRACDERIPLDLTRIRVDSEEPLIQCSRCEAMVEVPVFGADGWGTEDVSAANDEPQTLEAPCPEPAEVSQPDSLDEPPHAVALDRDERRDPTAAKAERVACRGCGADVFLDPDQMRLTWTHASLLCPACNGEVKVRRTDAFRNLETDVAWNFTSYASTEESATPDPEPAPKGLRRLLGRKSS